MLDTLALYMIWLGVDGNPWGELEMRFFKKIQDWILKSERVRKWILRFFTRSLGSWCIKGTEESTSRVDSLVSSMHHDPRDPELICLE